LLSASGAVEAIATILSLKDGILPATANSSDIDCDINLITDKPVRKKIDYAISNSFGFGGHNVCLLFKRWNEK
jgi:3-oxoacyl-[acyl-carrier-protein] synthase II